MSNKFLQLSRTLAAISLFFIFGFRYQDPTWLLPRDAMLVASFFCLAMLLGLATFSWVGTETRSRKQLAKIAIAFVTATMLIIGCVTFAGDLNVSYIAMIGNAIVFLSLLLLNYQRWDNRVVIGGNLALFLVAIIPSVTPSSISSFTEIVLGKPAIVFDGSVTYIASSRHDLKVTEFAVRSESSSLLGGGLNLVDKERLLVGTGDGKFIVVPVSKNSVTAQATSIVAPLNREAYSRDVTDPSPSFRVTDVFLQDSSKEIRSLFVSHHYWNNEAKCLTLRLSESRIDVRTMAQPDQQWQTRFESSPCLPPNYMNNENGGRIAFLPPSSLLLSVGTHEYDADVQDLTSFDASSYGKIIEIDTENWTSGIFSSGHRNAQGLLVTDSSIWATEHGPHGGDELNVVERGGNFGWPRSTYGTAYGQKDWYRIIGADEHAVGRKPIYSWVPSIGVSNLVQIEGLAFSKWQGDLMIGSLIGLGNGKSLFRVKTLGNKVLLIERIATGRPVRDLVETSDGRLILWDGSNLLQFVEPSSNLFSACNGCHALRWASHGIGPDLMGIVGGPVGGHKDFNYSQGLKDFGGRWTTDRLDAYLRDPEGTVPGTTMMFAGIDDPELRAEIIEYLAEVASGRKKARE